jgi:putative transposase
LSRQVRLEFKGGVYHVINHGNYRSDIFASDGAKFALLTALGETAQKLNGRIHAWAIMSNHYHVAAETPVDQEGEVVTGYL